VAEILIKHWCLYNKTFYDSQKELATQKVARVKGPRKKGKERGNREQI